MALVMAGEHLVSVVVDGLVSKLGSGLRSELGLVWNFKNDLDDMKNTLISIQAVLNDGEKQSDEKESVRLWLKSLKAAAYDIEDMLDQFQFQTQNQSKDTKVLKYFSCSKSFFSMSLPIMAQKLKSMKNRLQRIAEERSNYSLKEESITNPQEVIEGRTTFSAVNKDEVLGRDEEATEIINRLLSPSDAVSIISIVGIGGLGKTTLAKLIFNDGRIKGVFEPKIWVHAMDFKLEKLVDNVLSSLGTENSNILRNLEAKIKRAKEILDGKRYLIVLDDVWNDDPQKWNDFKQVLQDGKGDSKIIVTTRNERVSSIMSAEAPHKLKFLSDDVCSKLFQQRAFGSGGARDQNLVSIGEKIAAKCQGVPLTANALGGMLHFKSGEDAWKEVLHSEFWELKKEEGGRQSENEIISSLKLSYQYMPSSLKLCFVYCSMHPKAFKLDKDMLIQQWIAQRFIQKEHVGDYYVNYLLAISFLEETEEETYKMHDLVYDLATSIAGDEVSVLEAGKSQNINPEECRYASMIQYHQPSELQRDLPRKLRALHFQECRYLPKDIFSYTKYLRVLEFSFFSEDQLPTSIYKLKQLRFLKILGNFEAVNIGKLWTLETLIMSNSLSIYSLPDSIGSLKKLNTLKIAYCYRVTSLPESLGNLENLKTLNIKECRHLESLPESLGNLVNLKTLNIEYCYDLGSLPKSLGNLVNLKTLNIEDCYDIESLPESVGNLMNLEILNISGGSNIRALPVSIGKLTNLLHLNLSFSRELWGIPDSIGSLQKLHSLNLCGCINLKSLPESLGNLMELRILDIRRCGMLIESPKVIRDMTHLKIQTSEPLEFGTNTDIQLYLIDGPRDAYVVCNIAHAERTNIKERGGSIKSLSYECKAGEGGVAEAMLEALQPHQNLQEIFIEYYSGTMFPTWMRSQMESFLPNLVVIKLSGISDCEFLPMLGQLPKLEMIDILDMPKIRRITEEFCGARNTIGTSVSSLKTLDLHDMPNLEEWVTAAAAGDGERGTSLFPCLEKLKISYCPKLRVRPGIPPSVQTLSLGKSMLPLLTRLDVCNEMSLKHLTIWRLDMISLPESIRHLFTSLETLKIDYCESLATLPEWLGELSSLRSLKIEGCGLIDRLPKSIQHLTALEILDIELCSESLKKRTEKETGEDWDKISHIPNIRISKSYS